MLTCAGKISDLIFKEVHGYVFGHKTVQGELEA